MPRKDNVPVPEWFIAPSEAAKRIGVIEQTLANWRNTGRGPKFKKLLGWKVVYDEKSVEKWINEGVAE